MNLAQIKRYVAHERGELWKAQGSLARARKVYDHAKTPAHKKVLEAWVDRVDTLERHLTGAEHREKVLERLAVPERIVAACLMAIREQAAHGWYVYDQLRPYPHSLFCSPPRRMDCSGSAILAYKAGGAPDPNGTHYDGSGYTGSLDQRGHQVKRPGLGDLCFYDAPIGHVAVYLGGGRIFNMGAPGEPVEEPLGAPGTPTMFRSYPGVH